MGALRGGRRQVGVGFGAIVGFAFLCIVPLGPFGGTAASRDPNDLVPPPPDLASVNVTVDPTQWWISGGNATSVSAEWSGVPPGCANDPLWFQWSITSAGAQGSVAPATGSHVTFTADAPESGETNVTVRAAASLACGDRSSAVFRNATATFRVDSPPTLQELTVDPDPAPSGGPTEVGGILAGGEPPFTVTVQWDGNQTSTEEVATPGPFSIANELPSGTYDPTVVVTDAAGLTGRARVPEPVTVGDGFAIGLSASSGVAEVGVPVTFTIESDLPGPNYSSVAACQDSAGPLLPADLAGARFSCTFAAPGPANVSVDAAEVASPYAEASTVLRETVTALPSLSVPTAVPAAEVGTTAFVPVTIAGGVPPFSVSWRFPGNASAGNATVPEDGTFRAPVVPTLPGSEDLVVQAIDALGVPAANVTVPVNLSAPLSVDPLVDGAVANRTPELGIAVTVLAGTPPFGWVVVSSQANASIGGGSLEGPGAFAWNGTGTVEGPISAVLYVVDGDGAVRSVPCSAAPTDPVTVEIDADSAAPDHWSAIVVVGDGIPPYQVWANDSGGGTDNRTVASGGPVNLTGPCTGPGNLSVAIVVVDGFGALARASFSIVVPSTPRPGTGGGSEAWAGVGLLAIAAVGGVALLLWKEHRRRRDEAPPAPDPVPTLRAIIEPADGVDRSAVELLAEEQGIPLETVRTTLDRLVLEGRIRSERGPDGEEILAWRDRP